MIQITSADDARIEDYRSLANPAALQRAGLFVAEGRWVVERLLRRTDYRPRSLLVTPTALHALTSALGRVPIDRVTTYVVDQHVMDHIVGFNIHRGCLAIAERPRIPALGEVSLEHVRRVVVLEDVNNPDNVGGIFRSAAAFGIDLIVLGPASGDPLYRKAIRTSMAATLDVPFVSSGAWPDALDVLRDAGMHVCALTPRGTATRLESLPRDRRIALLLGTEGSGLSDEALARADVSARIHTTDRVDSLNVTIAASIAMHYFAS